MPYSNYGAEDFLNDEKFRQWVRQPDPELNYFWEKWLLQHPEKAQIVEEARQMVKVLQFRNYELRGDRKKKLWDNISAEIGDDKKSGNRSAKIYPIDPVQRFKKKKNKLFTILVKTAAVFIFFALLSILIIRNFNYAGKSSVSEAAKIEKSNPKGQKSKIFLPDGSIVYLNAASTITYPAKFGHERKIRLVGEAYFEVKKDVQRPFRVESGNVVTTALGTAFDVNAFQEDGRVTVSLVSGKVKIENLSSAKYDSLFLTPGLAVDYNKASKQFQKRKFDKMEVTAWRDGIIVFDNTSLSEVFRRLENWYGVDFRIDNMPENKKVVISGKFDNEYLNNVLTSLSYTARFSYELNDKEVYVHFKKEPLM